MNNNFLAMEKSIHDFAQELYFRNEAATDLVEKRSEEHTSELQSPWN